MSSHYAVKLLLFSGILVSNSIRAVVAEVPKPDILPRSAWEAQPEDNRLDVLRPNGTIKHISVHHTAVDKLRGNGTPQVELQIIQRGHRDDNHWGDIAYHYLIAPDGRIFAGRSTQYAPNSGTRYLTEAQWRETPIFAGEDVARDAQNLGVGGTKSLPESATGPRPGHVAGHVTICLLGNFMDVEPTDAAKQSFTQLAAYLLQKYQLTISDVWLHREVAATLCPGNQFYAWLRDFPPGERYSLGPGLKKVQALLEP